MVCYRTKPATKTSLVSSTQRILDLSADFDEKYQYSNPGWDYINRHTLLAVRVYELSRVHESFAVDLSFMERSWKKDVVALEGKQAEDIDRLRSNIEQWLLQRSALRAKSTRLVEMEFEQFTGRNILWLQSYMFFDKKQSASTYYRWR